MSKGIDETRNARAWLQPSTALGAVSILLPATLFAVAAWASYRETLHAAEVRVERTARVLEEHALKVFETDRLVIQLVNTRLRFMDWSDEGARQDLSKLIGQVQIDLDQVSNVTVIDVHGEARVTGNINPIKAPISFADRDYFQSLAKADQPLPYVSEAYIGRQTGTPIFNLAGRAYAAPGEGFTGVVVISADRGYFEAFYKTVDASVAHSVILVREDGVILASEPAMPIAQLPPDSTLRESIKTHADGAYIATSRLDGVDRVFAYRKIGPYPVYVRFGLSMTSLMAPWRSTLVDYGIAAALAALALMVASAMAVRQTKRERIASRRWQETAAALQAEAEERGRVEQQLRQSQKMEAVGRLTGGVAHDFNNLLTAVIGSLDLIQRRKTGIDARTSQLVANALEGALRAAALTNRLLAFSRQQPLQPARIDVNRLVGGMSDLLHRTLGENIAVETRLAPDVSATLADPNQLESAVLNLAVNARDAMPDGGRLTIETSDVSLGNDAADAPRDATPGDYVLIGVSDTGTGMSSEVAAQIFEPFFTTKPVGKGTGLGLSQVYGFVKQSGGHVAVCSAPGEGTTFRLYLPRAAEGAGVAAEAIPAAADLAPRMARGETILLVEDEEMVRRLGVAALEEAGYEVLAVSNGTDGLYMVRQNDGIALLFTDVVLGGAMNGRALADAALAERPGLPVLFTTGYARDALLRDGRLPEGLNFIGKPFTSASLVAKVQDLLDRRDAVATTR